MAAYVKVTKLVNPRRRATARRRPNSASRAKAVWKKLRRRADGTFKKLVKAKHHHKPSTAAKRRNPSPAQARPNRNPALMLTFGAPLLNPRRRKNVKANPKNRRRASHRRRNPVAGATRVVVVAPRANRKRHSRRRNPAVVRINRRRHIGRRRNPAIFGEHMTSIMIAEAIGGGLVGVTATKLIVGYMPASLVGIGGNWTKVLASGVSAFIAGFLAKKVSHGPFGDGVLFGGLMQTMSVALNAFLPSLGAQFGLGEIVGANFPLPMNPIAAGRPVAQLQPAVPTAARVVGNGLARAYSTAY
jgi:hypothetical protein